MKYLSGVLALMCLASNLFAQNVYTIKADSTKLTGCDSNELIIENHTQNVPGFLFNTGNGRTIFKRAVLKLNDSAFVIGGDTLRSNAWLQGGNRFGATGILGTLDSNHLDFYTKNIRRGRWTATGNLLIGTTTDNGEKFQIDGNGTINGPVVLGAKILIGDRLFNNVLGMRIYGDTLSGNTTTGSSHYAVIGLNLLETHSLYNTAKQGGGVYFDDRSTVMPLRFVVRPTGTTLSAQVGGVSTAGNFLLGATTDNGNKLQVKGGIYEDGGTFSKKYYTDIANALLRIGSGYEIYGVNHASGGYSLYISGGLDGSFNGQWDLAFGNNNNRIFVLKDSLISANQPVQINSGLTIGTQSSYLSSPYVGFKYQSGSAWNWAVVNSSNIPNFVVGSNGNILIGTTTDNSNKLQVSGTGYFSSNVGIGASAPSAQLHTTGTVRFAGLTNDSTQTRVLVSDASGNLYYRTAASLAANDILRSSLAVNGPVKARSLTLSQQGWPDYVFDSSYRLMPLQEVERFIQRNNHLPGIPSAAEINRDGLSVGDNQAALMKKIEELTLYNIAQQKRIDEQEERLARLEKELSKAKNRSNK